MILFLNQTTKDMERFCTRLPSSKYCLPVTADDPNNIAENYLVQIGYENLYVLKRDDSKSPCFQGPCAFVRHLGETDYRMLRQAVKRSCRALVDIRVLGSDDYKAIYNAILCECLPIIIRIFGLEHNKKNIWQFKRSKLS